MQFLVRAHHITSAAFRVHPCFHMGHNGRMCRPLNLTQHEARMLLLAAGDRLRKLVYTRASGAISGEELERRINMWKSVIRKLEECLE